MAVNCIYTDISENLEKKGDKRGEEYSRIAADCLSKIMGMVCINSRHVKMEINVTFTDNEEIREINREKRNTDRATDVLSFPLLPLYDGKGEVSPYDRDPETGCVGLGDIVISVEKAEEQAEEYGHSVRREVAFLACHGLLHLLGYDHMEPEREQVMMKLADTILDKAGYTRDA